MMQTQQQQQQRTLVRFVLRKPLLPTVQIQQNKLASLEQNIWQGLLPARAREHKQKLILIIDCTPVRHVGKLYELR